MLQASLDHSMGECQMQADKGPRIKESLRFFPMINLFTNFQRLAAVPIDAIQQQFGQQMRLLLPAG